MTASPDCKALLSRGHKAEANLPALALLLCTGRAVPALYMLASRLTVMLGAEPAAGTPCAALVRQEPQLFFPAAEH